MILSDKDIRARLLTGDLEVEPWPPRKQLQPASLELTLGNDFKTPRGVKLAILDGVLFYLARGMFVLGTTVEKVKIPRDLVAQVNGKSSWAREGLLTHATAGFIDPGFKGHITLELKNVSGEDLYLPLGAAICQLVFTQMTSPADRPYGSDGLGSHYQDQDGTTPARWS